MELGASEESEEKETEEENRSRKGNKERNESVKNPSFSKSEEDNNLRDDS